MDISDLRHFAAVAKLGSMKRAAEELHTVQSNVTARIRLLEEELGLPLFQRHPRGVTITPAGARMLPFAGRIEKLVADAAAAARDDGIPNGPLHIGSLETTTALRLAPMLSLYAGTYPEVSFVLTTGITAHLVTQVLESQLDGACVGGPIDHPQLDICPLFTEELVLVTAPSITDPRQLSARNNLKSIVFQHGCSYRQRLETYLVQRGITHARPIELGSLDAILACVMAGVGVTLLPRGVAAAAQRTGQVALHSLPPEQAMVQTVFIRRKDAYASSALTAFIAMAVEQNAAAAVT